MDQWASFNFTPQFTSISQFGFSFQRKLECFLPDRQWRKKKKNYSDHSDRSLKERCCFPASRKANTEPKVKRKEKLWSSWASVKHLWVSQDAWYSASFCFFSWVVSILSQHTGNILSDISHLMATWKLKGNNIWEISLSKESLWQGT